MIISYCGDNIFKIKSGDITISIGDNAIVIDDFKIDSPGEYERKNVFVDAPLDKKVFKTQVEDVSILYIGKTTNLSDREIELLDGVDIFILPCGQDDSMPLKKALELSATLEPSIVIPMFFDNIEELKKEGLEGELLKNVKITKTLLPQDGNEVMFLEKD